jgi:hypothetical protein
MSVLSIISDISVSSKEGNVADAKNFSIQGLDHTLLSRGTNLNELQPSNSKTKKENKRKKKASRASKGVIDVYGLKRESELCDELCGYADIIKVCQECKDITNALLTLGRNQGNQLIITGLFEATSIESKLTQFMKDFSALNHEDISDYNLAILLQLLVDEFVSSIKSNIPPVAPAYPYEWLRKRDMLSVTRFQETIILPKTMNMYDVPYSKNWWEKVANGIDEWKSCRRASLDLKR